MTLRAVSALMIVLLGVVSSAVTLSVLDAYGQDTVLPDQTVASEREALQQALRQRQDARAASRRLRAEAGKARELAERTQRQALALAAEVQAAEADIAVAQARIAVIDRSLTVQQANLAVRQEPTVRLMAALQNMARRPTAIALVQPGSLDDTVRIRAIMSTVTPQIERLTSDLRAEIGRGRTLRFQAERAKKSLQEGRSVLVARRKDLAEAEARQRLQSRDLAGNALLEEDRAIALAEEARDIEELIGRIEKSGGIRERLAALDGPILRPDTPAQAGAGASPSVTPPADVSSATSPAYRLPVIGQIVTGFGETSDTGVTSRGLTLLVAGSAQIIAPADGRVAYAGRYRSFGNIVIVEHDGGWTSLIAGLGDITADVGDEVSQGAPLASAPDQQAEIIVELRRNGRAIDIAGLVSAG